MPFIKSIMILLSILTDAISSLARKESKSFFYEVSIRKNFTIILFLQTLNFNAISQADIYASSQEGARGKIDSLTKILPAFKDAERIECLNELSESHLTFTTDTAKVYAEQALIESDRISYIKGKAKAYRNLGRIKLITMADFLSAEKYFEMSLELFIKTGDDQQIAWAWGAVGCSKWVLCKFPEAMKAFEKAEHLFKKTGDTTNLVGTYDYMFSTEFQRGNYAKSLEYILKRQDLTGEEDYLNLGDLYDALGDTETAEQYRRKIHLNDLGLMKYYFIAESFCRKNQYDSALHYYRLFSYHVEGKVVSGIDFGLSQVHLGLKNYDSALIHLNRNLIISKKSSDQNQVMRVLLILTKTYKETGNYVSAIKNGRHLLLMATETGARQFIRDAHFLLYELFDILHNKDSAYLHLKKYTTIKDSIDLHLAAQKLAVYKTKSEREQAQSRINALNDEKKFHQQQIKQTAQQKKFLIAGIIAVLLIAVVLFRYILLKRKNERLRLEHELELQQLENEKTKAELQQQATELEMQALRAQMNPHFIFNCLSSINRFILKNEAETASDYLTKFSRLIRLILQNSQVAFIPLESELETLQLYLELEALRFNHHFDYKIVVADGLDISVIKVPPLIIQPYAENAIWHGLMQKEEKGRLEIELFQQDEVLCCKISDDGIGRKKAAELKSKSASDYKSMGMQITASRIELLQSSKRRESPVTINDLVPPDGRAAGTEVIIKMPVMYDKFRFDNSHYFF